MPLIRRSFHILLFVFSSLAAALGQDSTMIARNAIGIGTGFAYSALKNEEFSPLTHSGSGVPIQVYYRQSLPRRQLHIQVFYSSMSLTSDFAGLTTKEQNLHFQNAAHYMLGKGTRKITVWGGFVLDGQLVRRSFSSALGSGTAGNNSSNEAFISLNPSVLVEKPVGKNKLTLQVWTALAAYVMLRGDDGGIDGKFVSVDKFSKTEARLSYSGYLNRRWEARIDGQFQFYALSVAEPVCKMNSQIIVSLGYRL